MSRRRQQAAKEPAEAPDILLRSSIGAYLRKHTATPTELKKQLISIIMTSKIRTGSAIETVTYHDKFQEIHSPQRTNYT